VSTRNLLFGCIAECPGPIAERERFDRLLAHNREVVAALPAEYEWPPLTRNMFSRTAAEYGEPGFHKSPTLHFGASFRGVDADDWAEWLGKLEALLRQLYWEFAFAHLIVEPGRRDPRRNGIACTWAATSDVIERVFLRGDERPMDEWLFSSSIDGAQP